MKKRAFHIRRGTPLLALSLAVVVAFGISSPAAGDVLLASVRSLGAVTASFSMPEASVAVLRSELEAMNDAESETASEAAEPVSPPTEETAKPLPAYDENDLAAAEALIPEERRGLIESVQFASSGDGADYFSYGAGSLRNATEYATAELQSIVSGGSAFSLRANTDEPQVLIVHTHTTECYDRFNAGFYDRDYPTRTTDSNLNVVAVGEALRSALAEQGIVAVHAAEYHDYPSYNDSYSRSRVTVEEYLAAYPSITLILDVHRDGMEREDGTRVKPVVTVNGQRAAQLMIVAGAGTDYGAVPNWADNLRLAAVLQNDLESQFAGLTRPVLFAYRYYNQDLRTSLLVEVGSQSNTLGEAKYAAQLLAEALAALAA